MQQFPILYHGEEYLVQVDDSDAERIQVVLASGPVKGIPGGRHNRKLSYVPAWKGRGFRPAIWVDKKLQYLSRWILGVTDPKTIVDHIDQNPLNNRRSNLRQVSRVENAFNSGGLGWDRSKTSQYRGVCWVQRVRKWEAFLKVGRKTFRKFFDTEIEAAIHRDWMVLVYLGSGITPFNVLGE